MTTSDIQALSQSFSKTAMRLRVAALWRRYLGWRVDAVNRLVSYMYGQRMQVLPKGHAGLAGAVVLWYLQDGFKQFIMIRNAEGSDMPTDGKARFVSCLGLGSHPSLSHALRAVLELQLGKVFVKTLPDNALAADRVSAAPMFNYTDEDIGLHSPVQTLVWVIQVQEAQVELIQADRRIHAVMVPEFALSSQKVSATHKALWQSVVRHIPKGKLGREALPVDESAIEEAIKDVGSAPGTPRVLH